MEMRVITVRLTAGLRERVVRAARWKKVSMNRFAENALLMKVLDAEREKAWDESKTGDGEPK